ncbi:TPA: hypothetical protein UM358_000344 [Stenotrophomonas maltophilia]|nr:hypothetical protein [Stenotrophomonas maltophilia]
MVKPTLVVLMSLSLTATVAEACPLSLKDTFETYLRVTTQGDEEAKAHLLASFLNAPPGDRPAIREGFDNLAVIRYVAMASEEPVASAMTARLKKLACHATNVEENASSGRGIVEYECSLPDLSDAFVAYRESQARSVDLDAAKREWKMFLEKYAAALHSAPSISHSMKAEFYRADENGPWISTDMMINAKDLADQLMPMPQWEERIQAEPAIAYSGIPACDLVLDAQLSFAERYDPDSPLQQGTTLQDIVAEKVRSLGPSLAEAYCRGTHDRNRAVWEGPISQEDSHRVRTE